MEVCDDVNKKTKSSSEAGDCVVLDEPVSKVEEKVEEKKMPPGGEKKTPPGGEKKTPCGDEMIPHGGKKTFGPVLEEMISWLHDTPPLSQSQLEALHVERSDFEQALKCVQPSAKREGFATVPDVTWDDVGSLQDIRDELQMAILVSWRITQQLNI